MEYPRPIIMKKCILFILICCTLISCKEDNIDADIIEANGISLVENRDGYIGLINAEDTSFIVKSNHKITKIKLDKMVLIEDDSNEKKPQLAGYWGSVKYTNETAPYILHFHFFKNTSNKKHYYSFYLKQTKINIMQLEQ
jgi:lipoprotein